MEFTYFIGADVSKNELDFAVMQGKALLFHREIGNDPASIAAFHKELGRLPGFRLEGALFCMEHTGIYNNHLLVHLHKKKANVCLEAASQIKNSMGNVRGKNDRVDAIRIAEYAYRNRDALRLWQPKREVVQRLAQLASTRSRLLEARKLLQEPLRENRAFLAKPVLAQAARVCAGALKAIGADLKKADAELDAVINSDTELKRLFRLVTSVDGVGKTTAVQVLVTTNEFTDIVEAKKFACYSGVAPFTRESGVFKGKARVSHMANKKIKTLLHMSALVAIQHNQELRAFYRRKVDEEKKNKMSVYQRGKEQTYPKDICLRQPKQKI